MTTHDPLISCICITRKKPDRLKIAINCFLAQTYAHKELVIVYEDDDIHTAAFLHSLEHHEQIRKLVVPARAMTLGNLRNHGIDQATGDYITQWDDDDWYHCQRLEHQYAMLEESGLPACILHQWIIFDATSGNAYLSNVRRWEGSLLCSRTLFSQYQYDDKKTGEDTAVIDALYKDNQLAVIDGMPHLYVYIFHGANTWNRQHWQLIFRMGLPLPTAFGQLLIEVVHPNADPVSSTRKIEQLLSDYKILMEDE